MKDFLLVNNSSSTSVDASGVVPLGSAIHGYGRNIRLNGSTIRLSGRGYYTINVSVSEVVTDATTASVALYSDGAAVAGASASATPSAAGGTVNLSFEWVIRKSCCCDDIILTLVSDSAVTTENVTMEVCSA